MPILSHFPSGGTDTRDATAAAADIANGKTAYVNEQKITGTSTKKYGIGDTIAMLQMSKAANVGTVTRTLYNSTVIPVFYVDSNYVYICSSMMLYKYNRTTGTLVWSAGTGNNITQICANSTYVYYTINAAVYSVKQSDGSSVTSISVNYNIGSICADETAVYCATSASPYPVVCLNQTTLATIWTYNCTSFPYTITQDANYIYLSQISFLISLLKTTGAVNYRLSISNCTVVTTTNAEQYLYTYENSSLTKRLKTTGAVIWTAMNVQSLPFAVSDTLPFIFTAQIGSYPLPESVLKIDGSVVEAFPQQFSGSYMEYCIKLPFTFGNSVYGLFTYQSSQQYYLIFEINSYSTFSINS